ncbi:MAG: tetratricopeptide repeat protein [Bryobacteraceae bacterium]|jgi:Tfp pilus assembly protein PilF
MFATLPRFAVLPGTLALLTLSAWAQTTVIEGTVEDQDHRPLGGVSLRIERQDLRGVYPARSSSNGRFFYAGLPVGVFRVFCEADADSAVEVKTQVGDPAVVKLTCAPGGTRQPDQGNQYRGSGRGILDRVRADLDRVARDVNSFSEDEMRRFNRVRNRIAEFQSAWEGGRFDREILSEIISGLTAIVERSRLVARDRDDLAEDLGRLKELRERQDRSSDPGASRRAVEAAFNEGLAAARAKDYRAAIAAFRRALAIDPSQHAIWANLAAAYTGVGSLAPAEDALAKAVQLKPQEGAYRNNYAIALAKSGKLEEAWTQLEEAARLEPANAGQYFYNLGAILVNSGHTPEAGRAFRRSIEANPAYAESHYQYGVWLMAQAKVSADGRFRGVSRAREAFETYLRLAPNGPHAEQARQMLDTIEPR